MGQVEWARNLARKLLEEPLPRRWEHTQGVADRAESLAPILGRNTSLVVGAAWLHDVGYSPSVIVTGFHPLDGARYLRDVEHAEDRLCRLVAHHSCAVIEAGERGLAEQLVREFPAEGEDVAEALTFSDMTIGPDGCQLSVQDRLADIVRRYGPDHIVSRSVRRAAPALIQSVESTRLRIAQSY